MLLAGVLPSNCSGNFEENIYDQAQFQTRDYKDDSFWKFPSSQEERFKEHFQVIFIFRKENWLYWFKMIAALFPSCLETKRPSIRDQYSLFPPSQVPKAIHAIHALSALVSFRLWTVTWQIKRILWSRHKSIGEDSF